VLKTLGTQLAMFLKEPQMQRNLGALLKYVALLLGVMVLFTVLFHVLMWRVEGQEHSWLTGLYWTVVTMSTLGFGDITFESDLGRTFSMFVLLSGVVLLLIVLPFVFIRHFYGPWLEAQLRLRAPRKVPQDLADHVILCDYDALAPALIAHLRTYEVPYLVLEPDPERAARLHSDGIVVMAGDVDATETYERAGLQRARLLVANLDDIANTNVILTAREVSPDVPIAALAATEDAVDLLGLAGADHVLPLRKELGEKLANRINVGHAQTHEIGRLGKMVIAEFPVVNTPLAGRTVQETRLRETLGINVVAIWDQGVVGPVRPDSLLTEHSLPIVVGTEAQMQELDELLYIYDTNWNPVLVLGGGKVGRSATRTLRRKGVPVHLVEKKPDLAARWKELPDRMFVGDAANRELLEEAGIRDAPAVLLTTNDDATNVYLASYCRRLNEGTRIVSRVTHERNVKSIRRAGADLVLSYASLGVEAIVSLVRKRPMILLGEGTELLEVRLPASLERKTLIESGIRARTGLNVVAVERNGSLQPTPRGEARLHPGDRLIMIGSTEGLDLFKKSFGDED
jgi:voltage-gated potassium channel